MNRPWTRRLNPVPASQWDEEILDALGAFPAGLDFVQRSRKAGEAHPRGENALGALALHPPLAKAFLTFNGFAATQSSLPARMRELIILRISWRTHSEYEFVQHQLIGRRAGLSDAELALIQADGIASEWSPSDALILRAVDELHDDARISDDRWTELRRHLQVPQLLDVMFLAGCYTTLGMVLNTIGISVEPGVDPLDDKTRSRLRAS